MSQRVKRRRDGWNRKRIKLDSKYRIRIWEWLSDDLDQALRIFEFTDIFFYNAVITFSLKDPVYILN